MKIAISLTLLIFSFLIFKNIFDPSSYIPSPLEKDRNFTRQEYLGDGLGKIYKNRFGVTYFNKIYPAQMKLNSLFFSDLGSFFVFIPLYISLLYFGFRKFNEK